MTDESELKPLKRIDIKDDRDFDRKKRALIHWIKPIKYIFKRDKITSKRIKTKNISLLDIGTAVVLKIEKKNQAFVVKIFALESWRLQGNYKKEVEMYQAIEKSERLGDLCPKLISFGKIYPDREKGQVSDWSNWEFPYICETFMVGTRMQNLWSKVVAEDMMNLAGYLGYNVAKIHSMDVNKYIGKDSSIGSADKANWKEFMENHLLKAAKMNKKYCGMPKKLLKQLDDYLPKPENMLKDLHLEDQKRHLSFLHADLCDENVLLMKKEEYITKCKKQVILYSTINHSDLNFIPTAIIDFGDSRIGDPVYDFVAIYLSSLRCDKILLRIFLYYYNKSMMDLNLVPNLPPPQHFSYIAMCYTLLNESPALKSALSFRPELMDLGSLKEIEKHLWDFNYIEDVPKKEKKNKSK